MSLTQDTLGYIFSHLSLTNRRVVERVCKPWCKASTFSTHLVKSLTINSIDEQYITTILKKNGMRCLRKITLNCVYSPQLINIANLEYLNIIFNKIFDINFEDLTDIFIKGKLRGIKIKTLKIRLYWNMYYVDSYAICKDINNCIKNISNCEELKYIMCYTGNYINSIGLNAILTCRNLKSIRLNVRHIYEEDLKDISSKCSLLENITLLDYYFTDIAIGYIAECKKLKSIKICIKHIGKGLEYLAKCINLKHISLLDCDDLDYKKFKHVSLIESITLDNCIPTYNDATINCDTIFTTTGLQLIFTCCNKLKKIKLISPSCRSIILPTIYFTLDTIIPNSLEYIILQNYNINFDRVINLTNLKKINIIKCHIQWQRATLCQYSIEEFKLCNVDINNDSIKYIVGNCVNLRKFCIMGYNCLTQVGLEYIIEKCNRLTEIFIGNIIVNDEFMRRCKELGINIKN